MRSFCANSIFLLSRKRHASQIQIHSFCIFIFKKYANSLTNTYTGCKKIINLLDWFQTSDIFSHFNVLTKIQWNIFGQKTIFLSIHRISFHYPVSLSFSNFFLFVDYCEQSLKQLLLLNAQTNKSIKIVPIFLTEKKISVLIRSFHLWLALYSIVIILVWEWRVCFLQMSKAKMSDMFLYRCCKHWVFFHCWGWIQ